MGIEGTQSINLKCHSCSSLHRLNTVWNILIHFADKSLFALDWTWMIALFLMLIIRNGKGFHSWADGNFRHHLFCTAALILDNDWQDFDYFNQVSWWQDWTTMAPGSQKTAALLDCWVAWIVPWDTRASHRANFAGHRLKKYIAQTTRFKYMFTSPQHQRRK